MNNLKRATVVEHSLRPTELVIGVKSSVHNDACVVGGEQLNQEDLALLLGKICGPRANKIWPALQFTLVGRSFYLGRAQKMLLKITQSAQFKLVVRDYGCDVRYQADGHRFFVTDNEDSVVMDRYRRSNKSMDEIRVLIVDDSETMQKILAKLVQSDQRIKVVGNCVNPLDAEGMIESLRPDVITLDLHMPHLNGVELQKRIKQRFQIPTIIISALSKEESDLVIEALQNGAIDYIQKPQLDLIDEQRQMIIEKICSAARVDKENGGVKPLMMDSEDQRSLRSIVGAAPSSVLSGLDNKLVVIGSSTGGVEALNFIMKSLPEKIPPILIVQHIPKHFSAAFAKRLNEMCPFVVKEAEDGDMISAGTVYIAPGGQQMGVSAAGDKLRIVLSDDPPRNRFKPSVDYLYASIAVNVPKSRSVLALILTGMGNDGAKEMLTLKNRGVQTIAQSEETCVVFGMPREAIELGGVDEIVPLPKIPLKIVQFFI